MPLAVEQSALGLFAIGRVSRILLPSKPQSRIASHEKIQNMKMGSLQVGESTKEVL